MTASVPEAGATERFSNLATLYDRNRPRYPAEVLGLLEREVGFTSEWVVADVGSGTGILTRLLLRHGNTVYGVEPNAAMRSVAEERLARGGGDGARAGEEPARADGPRPFHHDWAAAFRSVAGRAEATGLADAAVDLVAAAQAVHWFEAVAAATEFRRILKPGGWVLALWNVRQPDASPFARGYEDLLLTHCPEYEGIVGSHAREEDLDILFGPGGWREFSLPNSQVVDAEGLAGRLFSSSYAPAAGTAGYGPARAALKRLFDAHAEDGVVTLPYATRVYLGQPATEA